MTLHMMMTIHSSTVQTSRTNATTLAVSIPNLQTAWRIMPGQLTRRISLSRLAMRVAELWATTPQPRETCRNQRLTFLACKCTNDCHFTIEAMADMTVHAASPSDQIFLLTSMT